MSRVYILYDGRAEYDTDDATVVDTADSLEEALGVSEGYDYVCYSYAEVSTGPRTFKLDDKRFEFNPSSKIRDKCIIEYYNVFDHVHSTRSRI